MREDAVKCRVLWAASLKYLGKCEAALDVLEPVLPLENQIRPALFGWVLMEVGDVCLIRNDYERGFRDLARAMRLLRETNQVTGLAITIATIGSGYRAQGMFGKAIQFFRNAHAECGVLESKTLEAYIQLLLTETYGAMGAWRAAEREARRILPIFAKHGMVAEAVAALGILRESIRQQKRDTELLRELRERLRPGG